MIKRLLLGFITGLLVISIAFVGVAELTGNSLFRGKKANPIAGAILKVSMPIFTAVTENSRTRTCIANQREIVSQITTYTMSTNQNLNGTITYTSDGDSYGTIYSDVDGMDAHTYESLFQQVPYCPSCGSYSITIVGSNGYESDGAVTVYVECIDNHDGNAHLYN